MFEQITLFQGLAAGAALGAIFLAFDCGLCLVAWHLDRRLHALRAESEDLEKKIAQGQQLAAQQEETIKQMTKLAQEIADRQGVPVNLVLSQFLKGAASEVHKVREKKS